MSRGISLRSQTDKKTDWGCRNLHEVTDDWREGQRCREENQSDADRRHTVAEVGDGETSG